MFNTSYCIRTNKRKVFELVMNGQNLVQFDSAIKAHAYIIYNKLFDKAYPHPMTLESDWYDYTGVQLEDLQNFTG